MKYGMVDINWEHIGAVLASAGSDEQVDFFKAFVKECNTWGTSFQVEQQLAFVNHELSESERKTLSMLGYRE